MMPACVWPRVNCLALDATDAVACTLVMTQAPFQCRYFPCTVQWFLERSELQLVRKGWRRRVQRVLQALGSVDGDALRKAEAWFTEQKERLRRHHFMLLRLVDPVHRVGQPDRLNQARVQTSCGATHACLDSWALQRLIAHSAAMHACIHACMHAWCKAGAVLTQAMDTMKPPACCCLALDCTPACNGIEHEDDGTSSTWADAAGADLCACEGADRSSQWQAHSPGDQLHEVPRLQWVLQGKALHHQ